MWARTGVYVCGYAVLVYARLQHGAAYSDADTVARAFLEAANCAALCVVFALGLNLDAGAGKWLRGWRHRLFARRFRASNGYRPHAHVSDDDTEAAAAASDTVVPIACPVAPEPCSMYTFGAARVYVLAALTLSVLVAVDVLLSLAEVVGDLVWMPDKHSALHNRRLAAFQLLVGASATIGFSRSSWAAISAVTSRGRSRRRRKSDHHGGDVGDVGMARALCECGVYMHGLFTTTDAALTLLVALVAPSTSTSVVLHVFCALATAMIVAVKAAPLAQELVALLLHAAPNASLPGGHSAVLLEQRLRELASTPGVKNFSDVHLWSISPGARVCTLRVGLLPNCDEQAVHERVLQRFNDVAEEVTVQFDQHTADVVRLGAPT